MVPLFVPIVCYCFIVQIYNFSISTDVNIILLKFQSCRPISSPAIAGFPTNLYLLKNTETPAFFFRPELAGIFLAQICWHFVLIQHCRHFFSDLKLPAYLPTWNCRHFFQPKIADIFSIRNLDIWIFILFSLISPMTKVFDIQWIRDVNLSDFSDFRFFHEIEF